MTLRRGLLSTARTDDAIIVGVRESGVDEVLAVASRDGDRARVDAPARGEDAAGRARALRALSAAAADGSPAS